MYIQPADAPLSTRAPSSADLYAIIQTIEKLDRAYTSGWVDDTPYTTACQRLLGQYKTLYDALRDKVPNVDKFMEQFRMQCAMAPNRIKKGIPATLEHAQPAIAKDRPDILAVAETTGFFITAKDSLHLNMKAVDQLCPTLSDLLQSMARVAALPANFPPRDKIKDWHQKLFEQPASYELSEEEVRQLAFDLDAAYNEFMRAIK